MAKDKAPKAPKFDLVKWLVVLLVLFAGVAANYFYSYEPRALKLAAWILIAIVAMLIASRTMRGQRVWRYLKEARNEIRRVVWPKRRETVQMTLLVFAMVLVLALILWGVDSILMSLLTWFTGAGSN